LNMADAVARASSRSGLTGVGRRLRTDPGAVIFYGHRVASDSEGYLEGLRPEWLEEQLSYITRHFNVVPLSTLVSWLRDGEDVPDQTAVLTFDDGFRDNVEAGAPVLKKYRVPATIFAVTGCLTSGELPWSQRLGYIFQHTSQRVFPPGVGTSSKEELLLETATDRRRAYGIVKRALVPHPAEERDRLIAGLASALGVDPPRNRMMTWEDARALRADGIEIGAHTESHPLLAEIPHEEAVREMEASRRAIQERLGDANPAFCFPAGSVNEALWRIVPKLGFRSCFLPNKRIRYNQTGRTTPFTLARVGLPNRPAWALEAELHGVNHWARLAIGRYSPPAFPYDPAEPGLEMPVHA